MCCVSTVVQCDVFSQPMMISTCIPMNGTIASNEKHAPISEFQELTPFFLMLKFRGGWFCTPKIGMQGKRGIIPHRHNTTAWSRTWFIKTALVVGFSVVMWAGS